MADLITADSPNLVSWLEYVNDLWPRDYVGVQNVGKRYIRICEINSLDGKHGAVFGFVDRVSGDILFPKSWERPAKHARGNLFSEQGGREAIEMHGGETQWPMVRMLPNWRKHT